MIGVLCIGDIKLRNIICKLIINIFELGFSFYAVKKIFEISHKIHIVCKPYSDSNRYCGIMHFNSLSLRSS